MGCKNPDTSGGQWNWLPPATELAGFNVREGAVCRCNKRGCQDSFRGERKRKLREAMFQGNTNDSCLPKQYKVKEIEEIWGIRYAHVEPISRPPMLLTTVAPLCAAGTPT